jgi:lipase chaperone LimK
VLSDKTLRHTLGQQAAESTLRHFDLRRQVEIYLEWYQDLAARRSAVPMTNNIHALPNPV